jgi:hypothetical protein
MRHFYDSVNYLAILTKYYYIFGIGDYYEKNYFNNTNDGFSR